MIFVIKISSCATLWLSRVIVKNSTSIELNHIHPLWFSHEILLRCTIDGLQVDFTENFYIDLDPESYIGRFVSCRDWCSMGSNSLLGVNLIDVHECRFFGNTPLEEAQDLILIANVTFSVVDFFFR